MIELVTFVLEINEKIGALGIAFIVFGGFSITMALIFGAIQFFRYQVLHLTEDDYAYNYEIMGKKMYKLKPEGSASMARRHREYQEWRQEKKYKESEVSRSDLV